MSEKICDDETTALKILQAHQAQQHLNDQKQSIVEAPNIPEPVENTVSFSRRDLLLIGPSYFKAAKFVIAIWFINQIIVPKAWQRLSQQVVRK